MIAFCCFQKKKKEQKTRRKKQENGNMCALYNKVTKQWKIDEILQTHVDSLHSIKEPNFCAIAHFSFPSPSNVSRYIIMPKKYCSIWSYSLYPMFSKDTIFGYKYNIHIHHRRARRTPSRFFFLCSPVSKLEEIFVQN